MSKYRIIASLEGNRPEQFLKQVNEALKEGWKPQGGLQVISTPSFNIYFFQAMVKE